MVLDYASILAEVFGRWGLVSVAALGCQPSSLKLANHVEALNEVISASV
jgi:hypothetical protein